MKTKRAIPTILLSLLVVFAAYSQEPATNPFSCDLELRPRTEYRNGYKKLRTTSSEAVLLTSQRTRLGVNFNKERINSRVSIQDVRARGELEPRSDVSGLGLHEAWLEFRIVENLTAKVERQELNYEDERLLATTNWHNVASAHDLLLFKYEQNNLLAHAGFAYNNSDDIEKTQR